MDFEESLALQIEAIKERLCTVYHISLDDAEKKIRDSSFYRVLSDKESMLLDDGAEVNFLRLQNEIEYGRWDK